MSKINDFLNEAGVFFLATADGDQPKLRPLGLHFEADGKEMFGIGDFKNVYRQLKANPKCEIVASKPNGHWMSTPSRLLRSCRTSKTSTTSRQETR